MSTTRTLRTAFATAAIVLTASACGTTSTSTTSPDSATRADLAAADITSPAAVDDNPEIDVIGEPATVDVSAPASPAPSTTQSPGSPDSSPTEQPPADTPPADPQPPLDPEPAGPVELLTAPPSVSKVSPQLATLDVPLEITTSLELLDPALELTSIIPLIDFGLVYDAGADEPSCGAFGPIPVEASTTASVMIDVIGDGSPDDTITSYFDGDWHLRLVTGGGDTSDLTIAGVGAGVAKALGAIHVDDDAAEQLLAIVGSGASAVNLGVFGADSGGCLFRFTHPDDTEIGLSVGATTGWHQGVRCTDGAIISYGANNDGPDYWTTWGVGFERVGTTHLDFGLDDIGSSDTAGLVDYFLDCPGLTL